MGGHVHSMYGALGSISSTAKEKRVGGRGEEKEEEGRSFGTKREINSSLCYSSCQNRTPQTGWLKQQKYVFSWF